MNWISQNKFMTGFIAFMVIGVGALGFLLIEALGDYDARKADYNTKYGQLDNLQNRKPYPNDKNVEAYGKQRDDLQGVIDQLEQGLGKIQFPLDPNVVPQAFQKNLQAARAEVKQKAADSHVQIPENFALGFDPYVNTLAVQGAAPALDRQLKAVQFVIDELLDGSGNGKGVTTITSVVREQVPEEKGEKPEQPEKPPRPGSKPSAPSTPLVSKTSLEINFTTDWSKLRKTLNDLVQTKQQFYIVRLVSLTTDAGKDQPIPKAETAREGAAANGVYVPLGRDEKLVVTLSLEIVNFNQPPAK